MVQITSDSTCDLSKALVEQYGIPISPLSIAVDGKLYKDGVEITSKEVFELGEQGKVLSTTAVNEYEYETFFKQHLTEDGLVHFCISSTMSVCYENALKTSKKFPNVYVVDSKNLSTGIGHLVLDAAIMAKEGKSAKEIYETVLQTIPKVESSFILDTLEYIKRGGRCSALVAFGGKLLHLKPCLNVVDGSIKVGKKYTGSLAKCLERYLVSRLENRDDIDYSRIFITYSSFPEDLLDVTRQIINQYGPFDEVLETTAGCTVSTHCGPNTLGILFKRK